MIFLRKTKIFLFNGILLTITSLFLRSISIFFSIYISNKISKEAIGIYQLIMSVYMFFVTISCSGINLAMSKIISEQIAYNQENSIKTAIKKGIFYSLIMGLLAFIILFFSSPFICENWLHGKISPISLKIISISLPFISVSNCINGYFSARRNVKKTAICQVIEQIFKICFICFLLNVLVPSTIEDTCIYIVLGNTLSEILSFVFLLLFYYLDINKIRSKFDRNNNFSKQIFRITFPIAFTSYIRSGLSTLKQILIPIRLEKSGISCEHALSEYGAINGMVMPLILFPCNFISSFSSLLIPEFSYLNAKKDKSKINFAILKILKFSFIFSFLIMGIFWCFSNELSNIIYPKSEISIFVKILSPLIILMYIDNIVDSILKGLDKQVSVMGVNILDLFISISFIYFLLPIKGINGYFIVLFISEFFNGFISFFILLKETDVKIDFLNWILKPCISIFLLHLIFNNIFYNVFIFSNVINLIIKIITFCILYFVFIFLLKGLVKNDLKI